MLKSVDVPILDINKCVKEYPRAVAFNSPKYVDGMNICAGELGKSGCKVRFKMQKFKKATSVIDIKYPRNTGCYSRNQIFNGLY